MASPSTIRVAATKQVVVAETLRPDAFAPFGQVVQNPRRDVHPVAAFQERLYPSLPFNAVAANQGSAIKYQHVTRMVNLYDQAPSTKPGLAVMNMFVCAARQPLRPADAPSAHSPNASDRGDRLFPISVLERHPFTTQTFIPLTSLSDCHYLVVVAPSLPPSAADLGLPVPDAVRSDSIGTSPSASNSSSTASRPSLPGRGLPDLERLRAFVATTEQAVTYGAGTWHAPMIALGTPDSAIDFVVVQFANEEALEDCQEVVFVPLSASGKTVDSSTASTGVMVQVLPGNSGPTMLARL